MYQYFVVGDTSGSSWYYDSSFNLVDNRFSAKASSTLTEALNFFEECDLKKEMQYKQLKIEKVEIDSNRIESVSAKFNSAGFDLFDVAKLLKQNPYAGSAVVQEVANLVGKDTAEVLFDICYFWKGDRTSITKSQAKKLLSE